MAIGPFSSLLYRSINFESSATTQNTSTAHGKIRAKVENIGRNRVPGSTPALGPGMRDGSRKRKTTKKTAATIGPTQIGATLKRSEMASSIDCWRRGMVDSPSVR